LHDGGKNTLDVGWKEHTGEMDTISSKTYEALLMCQSYRFIAKWIALLNCWLSCKVNNGTKSLWSVSAGNKDLLFSLHTVVKLFFNDITIF